ncbi:MAG: hypothetical protein JXR69_05600 [Candidatus Delongbacteria bacterium]|nr:hypothetical protein [Candidatus Delongbacteria bacterium]
MGEIICKSIKYIQQIYPEMKIVDKGDYLEIKGRFIIKARYEDIVVNSAPKLKIIFAKTYPTVPPIVYETENKVRNEHKLSNKALCVATHFDLLLQLSNSTSIADYINKFLIPYFISHESYIKTGNYIYGDRAHGAKGIYQSIGDFFNVKDDDREFLQRLIAWAIKKNKFRITFPENDRYKYIRKYAVKIGRLRKVGILNLKNFYKNIEKIDEYEKTYYEYKKLQNKFINRLIRSDTSTPKVPLDPITKSLTLSSA